MPRSRDWQNAAGPLVLADDYLAAGEQHGTSVTDLGVRRMQRWAADRRNLFYPTPNGYNDPLSVAFVLDALVRMPKDHAFRAKTLTELLAREYPAVVWDSVIVGRILAELADEAAQDGNNDPARVVLRRGHDYKGGFYWLQPTDPKLGRMTDRWLSDRREWVGTRAREATKAPRHGSRSPKAGRGLRDMIWADYAA